MWRFSFFFENFPKRSLYHVCFHGGLFNGFLPQKINKIKLKLATLHLFVCLSRFKKTLKKPRDFTVCEGHGYPHEGESAKTYGLKVRCLHEEHVGEHVVNLGHILFLKIIVGF